MSLCLFVPIYLFLYISLFLSDVPLHTAITGHLSAVRRARQAANQLKLPDLTKVPDALPHFELNFRADFIEGE